ncbi:MAG: hypothetical protein LAN18_15825 [Acidobacteriia bacterium]|nr:hypothetical protein [Terriglobia bacterium]
MKHEFPSISRDIVLALVIGATIVLLLAVAENQDVAPNLNRILLSPGLRLAHATGYGTHDIGVVLAMVADVTVYGFVSFLVLRVLRTMLS